MPKNESGACYPDASELSVESFESLITHRFPLEDVSSALAVNARPLRTDVDECLTP
jgi:hypothetical protein